MLTRGTSLQACRPSLVLRPRAPFRLDLTVWALRRQALNEVDAWDGSTYRRVLAVNGKPVEVALTQEPGMEMPVLRVTLNSAGEERKVRVEVRAALEQMLALELDVDSFYVLAAADPLLGPLVERFRGLRPPALRPCSSVS